MAIVLATLDTLRAIQLDDGTVALEVTRTDGLVERTPIRRTDTLRVSSTLTRGAQMAIVSTELVVSSDIAATAFTFELDLTSGGVLPNEVAALAGAVAAAAGCELRVVETVEPHPPVAASPAPVSPPVAEEIRSLAPAPPPLLLADRPDVEVFATLLPLKALRLLDGTVIVEDATTGARWPIGAADLLRITPYFVPSGPLAIDTYLIREGQRLGTFRRYQDPPSGIDDEMVATFAAAVAKLTGCSIARDEVSF
jgi:hypothetical protein